MTRETNYVLNIQTMTTHVPRYSTYVHLSDCTCRSGRVPVAFKHQYLQFIHPALQSLHNSIPLFKQHSQGTKSYTTHDLITTSFFCPSSLLYAPRLQASPFQPPPPPLFACHFAQIHHPHSSLFLFLSDCTTVLTLPSPHLLSFLAFSLYYLLSSSLITSRTTAEI